jgi:hypothetical protein
MEKFYSAGRAPKQLKRLRRIIRSRFYLHLNHDTRNSIMVAGTGRSGTTWVAEMIASQIPCRIMFEPFHFRKVLRKDHHLFHYMRPEQEDSVLYAYANNVLSGRIRKPWIDWHNDKWIASFRLIKEIRANLFLKWLKNKFPEVPLIFIIRHPCAVVLSRMELGWATDSDIQPFLDQKNLVEDFLCDKLELIHRAETDVEKHALIWCITNLIPLKQFKPGEITVMYYEDLCLQPEYELLKILKSLNQEATMRRVDVKRPSTTSSISSAVVTGADRISRWKNTLKNREIDSILNIVREFGLDDLYGEAVTPQESVRLKQT